jgi:hypothetical protein
MIEIKLVCMSRAFHCAKLHLSMYNGSWVFFIKENVNFKFQPPLHVLIFGFSHKWLKVVDRLKIYQLIRFRGLTLTGASFTSISEIWTSAILER